MGLEKHRGRVFSATFCVDVNLRGIISTGFKMEIVHLGKTRKYPDSSCLCLQQFHWNWLQENEVPAIKSGKLSGESTMCLMFFFSEEGRVSACHSICHRPQIWKISGKEWSSGPGNWSSVHSGHVTPKTPDFRMAGNCLAMPSNHKAPMLVHNNCCQLLAFKTKHRRQDKSWLSSYKISSTGLHLPMVNFSASGVLFTVPHLDKISETKMLFLVFLGGINL